MSEAEQAARDCDLAWLKDDLAEAVDRIAALESRVQELEQAERMRAVIGSFGVPADVFRGDQPARPV